MTFCHSLCLKKSQDCIMNDKGYNIVVGNNIMNNTVNDIKGHNIMNDKIAVVLINQKAYLLHYNLLCRTSTPEDNTNHLEVGRNSVGVAQDMASLTIRCRPRQVLSCTRPLPCTPLCHLCPLPCTPPCHACPLPCTPTCHACRLPCTPSREQSD